MLKRLVRILLLLVGVSAMAFLYGWLVEREWVDETEFVVESPEWQGRDVRLAVLADLHIRTGDGEYLDTIVQRTLEMKPDAVLLLGDFMAGSPQSKHEASMSETEIAEHLKPLASLPCHAVLGNHDYYHNAAAVCAALENIGVTFVEAQRVRLLIDGLPLDIGGIHSMSHYHELGQVPEPQPGVPLVMLSHSPAGAEHAHPGTLVTLAGHMHGGQFRIPGVGPVFHFDMCVPRAHTAGAFTLPNGQLVYVSRGLGTGSVPIRICCRPELLVLIVRKAKQSD